MTSNNPTPSRNRTHDRHGGTLISLIAVMLILGVLGVTVVAFTHNAEHSYLSANAGSRAYYVADSGVRYAQDIHYRDLLADGDGWLNGRSRQLSLQGGEVVNVVRDGTFFIATATVDAGSALEARSRVRGPLTPFGLSPPGGDEDSFAIYGEVGVSLGTHTVIEGDVAIIGDDVTVRGTVEGSILAGDVTLNSDHSLVEGDIYSTGEVDVKGAVEGDIHAADSIDISSDAVIGKLIEDEEGNVIGVEGGWLFSNHDIMLQAGSTVLGSIYSCGGSVTLGGGGSGGAIVGSEAYPIEIRATGDVIMKGTSIVYGEVHAGGRIILSGSARIEGEAWAKDYIDLSGSATIDGDGYASAYPGGDASITGDAFVGEYSPKEPVCPDLTDLEDLELPEATEFTAGGEDHIVPAGTAESPTDYVLEPGTYGDLVLPDNSEGHTRLYLQPGSEGHGNYYFDSVTFGSNTTLYLNLSGEDDIRVFVTENVMIESPMNVFVSVDGSAYYSMADLFPLWNDPELGAPSIEQSVAARVYWEAHGLFELGAGSHWFGSIYTPYPHPSGNSLRVGNNSNLIGSYYSGGGHTIGGSTVTVIHVAPNYFEPPED